MCGIAGFLGVDGVFKEQRLLGALRHRGPDDRGHVVAKVGEGRALHLVHTRLSILDLSAAAAQPMRDPASGGVLAFNGEIFNYRALRRELGGPEAFRSSGDTEVLLRGLATKGTDFLRGVDGMFAFLWHDPVKRRLVVARDPLGIKPLYYARSREGGWLFASEVRAILDSGLWEGGLHLPGVLDYLRFGALQDPDTLFAGIQAFPAGHWGELDLDDPVRLRTQSFWPIEKIIAEAPPKDFLAWHDEVWRETVLDHLESDVPTGVFLSAGLDSTALIEAIAPEQRARVTAFTLAGELTTSDEGELAAITAANLGVRHKSVRLSDAEVRAWVREGLGAMDQPSSDGINTYLVSRASRAADLTVVLSGTGADELHGAYGHAATLSRISGFMRAAGPFSPLLRLGMGRLYGALRGPTAAERLDLMLREAWSPWRLTQERRRFFTRTQIGGLWPRAEDLVQVWRAPTDDPAAYARLDDFNAVSLAELRGYTRDMLLRDADWATMANQQELRVPFLGRRYVECALRMPPGWRTTRDGVAKPLIAATLSEANRELVRRPKTGFNLANGQLLLGPFRDDFHAAAAALRERLGFELDADAALRGLASRRSAPEAMRMWSLLSLGSYLTRHAAAGTTQGEAPRVESPLMGNIKE
jgi:asparagine synthase (glutamine-hydrolysing)